MLAARFTLNGISYGLLQFNGLALRHVISEFRFFQALFLTLGRRLRLAIGHPANAPARFGPWRECTPRTIARVVTETRAGERKVDYD